MTFYVETEEGIDIGFPFDADEVAAQVAKTVLADVGCPYDVSVNLLLTDNDGIRGYNREYREIDKETDVLSFPNLEFQREGVFEIAREQEAGCFDPDTGELVLGDIIISADRVREQAEQYGHSLKREFAFLVAHSMLHLCGYDHMEEAEAERMEAKQEAVLDSLGITRDVTE